LAGPWRPGRAGCPRSSRGSRGQSSTPQLLSTSYRCAVRTAHPSATSPSQKTSTARAGLPVIHRTMTGRR
jgi:hypothetical protein